MDITGKWALIYSEWISVLKGFDQSTFKTAEIFKSEIKK